MYRMSGWGEGLKPSGLLNRTFPSTFSSQVTTVSLCDDYYLCRYGCVFLFFFFFFFFSLFLRSRYSVDRAVDRNVGRLVVQQVPQEGASLDTHRVTEGFHVGYTQEPNWGQDRGVVSQKRFYFEVVPI